MAARRELGPLSVLLLVAAGLWSFVEIADEVSEGDTLTFDRTLLIALRNPADLSDPLGPGWLQEAARDITGLGSMVILTLVTIGVAGFLVITRKSHAALLLIIAVGGGTLLSTLLKLGFQRPRPDLVPHATQVYTASFPSGHAMLSAVTYLTLGALLTRVHARRRVKAYLLTIAIFLTMLVGVSRVYLGVHWPSDVLAGWSVGSAWAMACWLVAWWLQRRGQVERAPPFENGDGELQPTDHDQCDSSATTRS